MRRTVLAVPLALVFAGWLAPQAIAQDTKSARGTVTAMAGNSITIKAGEREMTFTVDPKTEVTAEGAGTATRTAVASGKPGPKLAELVKVGDPVEVSYREMKGTMQATGIRRVSSVGSGRTADDSTTVTGTVDAVTASSLSISGSSGGGSKFTQTITVDTATKVVGRGAGTTAAAKGGKMVLTDYVNKGDQVRVTYRTKGDTIIASEITVTKRAP